MEYKLAILGFGIVGREFARLLQRKSDELARDYGLTWRVTGLATRRLGMACDPAGLDLEAALSAAQAGQRLEALHSGPPLGDAFDFIARCGADVLFETTVLNPQTGQPALDHVRAALNAGMHVITANKGPLAFAYRELVGLARRQGKAFLFESTVMDGAPVFSLARDALLGANVLGFRGILNSTTNFILTHMEAGHSFDEAVRQAQAMGIAEADPSLDVDGWDAATKTAILATVLMGAEVTPAQVERVGIRQVRPEHVQAARMAGRRIKLVCRAGWQAGRLVARVAPEEVPADDLLASIHGTSSALSLYTDTLKQLTIVEHDPGPAQTAYGLLRDLLAIVRQERRATAGQRV
jgi:homoserine dehydrogenase